MKTLSLFLRYHFKMRAIGKLVTCRWRASPFLLGRSVDYYRGVEGDILINPDRRIVIQTNAAR